MPVFEYLAQHPEAASAFSETIVRFHGAEPPTVAKAYEFSGVKTLVYVRGATGNMLVMVFSEHPGVLGVLFDLPHGVRDAGRLLIVESVLLLGDTPHPGKVLDMIMLTIPGGQPLGTSGQGR